MERENALQAWLKTNKTNSYKPEELPPEINPPTNAERSEAEVFAFLADPPEKYFLYINSKTGQATTWTGQKLGDVRFGHEYHSNMGDKRQSVRVYAVNGKTYSGTYYKSSGDYARVRIVH